MQQIPKANILIVDDEPKNLSVLESILEPLNQKIIKAESGNEALKKILAYDFVVILLDIRMPGMNGFEVAEIIRKRERTKSTPIVFLTAYDKEDPHIIRGYQIGAVDYLFKPIIPDILKAKVCTFIELYKKNEEIKQKEKQIQLLKQIKKQERVITGLRQFSEESNTQVTTQALGLLPLKKASYEVFRSFVNEYKMLIDYAIEMRTHKVDYNISEELKKIAYQLGEYNAVPRDIIDIHLAAVKNTTNSIQKKRALACMEEARILVLELMGYLASFYRNHSIVTYKNPLEKNEKL